MEITQGIAELVGAIIGDGHIYRKKRKYQIGITGNPITDKEYFDKLKKLIFKEWNKKNIRMNVRAGGLRIVFDSKEICGFLINDLKMFHGKGKCNNIIIPQQIFDDWNLAKHSIRGIADTDGTVFVSKKPGVKKYPSIELVTTSKNLANQLKELLSNNGFRVTLREWIKKDWNVLPVYRVCLYGQVNLKRWIDKIGFSNPYKQQRALSYLR